MCEPTTLAIAMAATSAVSSVYGAKKQQDANDKYNQSVANNYGAQMNALSQQQSQVNAQATQQMSQIALQAMAQRARLQTLAGEAGVGAGGTYDRLQNAVAFTENQGLTNVATNLNNTQGQLSRQGGAMEMQAKNSMRAPVDWTGVGLQILGAGLGAYGKISSMPQQKAETPVNVVGTSYPEVSMQTSYETPFDQPQVTDEWFSRPVPDYKIKAVDYTKPYYMS